MQPKMYWVCYVEGKSIPRVLHEEWEEAHDEGVRLAQLPENRGKKVYIMESIGFFYTPTPPVNWYPLRSCDG